MAIISTYSKDLSITANDKLLGSNYQGLDNQGRPIFSTVNYRVDDLLTYFTQNIEVDGANLAGLSADINELKTNFTYDVNGNITAISNSLISLIVNSTVSDSYATAAFQSNIEASVMMFDGQGNYTLATSFADDIITTTSSDRFATSTKVNSLGSKFGTFAGDTFTLSQASIQNIFDTFTSLDFSNVTYITDIEAVVAGRPKVFRQITAPATTEPVGSIWYDTDDDNKVYILVAGAPNVWTLTDDSRIGASVTQINNMSAEFGSFDVNNNFTIDTNAGYFTAVKSYADTNSAAAQKIVSLGAELVTFDVNNNVSSISLSSNFTSAIDAFVSDINNSAIASKVEGIRVQVEGSDGTGGVIADVTSNSAAIAVKPDVFRQALAPATTEAVGSIWFDTDDNNKAYVLVAGTPNVWTETRDQELIDIVATKPFIFRQISAPATSNPEGSLWYDTDDENKLYVLASSTWVLTQDGDIATAQATADGRPKVFRQISAPATTEPEFSVWYDTDDNNLTYVLIGDGGNPEVFTWTQTIDGRVTDLLAFAEAKYSLNVDANGVVTGLELYSASGPNTTVSEFKITADKFIVRESSTDFVPFILDGSALKLNVPLNGVSGSFSGDISAATGTIGGWTINPSNLQSPLVSGVNKLTLSPANGITIKDPDNNTAVQINQGALSQISSTTPGIVFGDAVNGYITSLETNNTSPAGIYTYAVTTPPAPDEFTYSIGLPGAFQVSETDGIYAFSFTSAATGTLVTTDASFSGQILMQLGVQFASDSGFTTIISDEIIDSKSITGASQTLALSGASKDVSLGLAALATIYFRFYWRTYVKGHKGGTMTFTAQNANFNDTTGTITFNKYIGTTEITDEGIQIVDAPNLYFKVDRANYLSGNPYVSIGGYTRIDGDLEVTGNINIVGDVVNSDVTVDNLIARLAEIDSDITIGAPAGITTTFRSDISAGNITTSGYLRGPATFIIDPAAYGDITGLVQILGDLRVDGTTTTVNSTVVEITDKNITLAKDAVTTGDANGAGFTVAGANATLTYASATDDFTFNKNVNASAFIGSLAGNASSASKWTTAKTITLGGDLTGNVSIDGSSNVTLTAAVVNDSHTHDGRYYTETEIGNFFSGGTAISGYNKTSWDSAYSYSQVGHLPLAGGTLTGALTVDDKITITGTTNNLLIDETADGTWRFYDTFQNNGFYLYSGSGGMDFHYNGVSQMVINGSGVVFTGTVDISSADLNIGAADIIFDTVGTAATRGMIWDVDGAFLSKLVGGGTNGGMVELYTNLDDAITTGDVFRIKEGSVAATLFSINGNGVISGNGSGLTGVNATTVDGFQGSQFLRSDANDTMSGKLTINATGTGNSPSLRINNSSSATFIHSFEAMGANMIAGQHNIQVFGKSADTKNSGYIGYYWAGLASNSNFVTIGHWGNDDLFRVYADGNVTVGTNQVLHAGNYSSYVTKSYVDGLGIAASSASNSDALDGLDSTQFLRSDTAGVLTGTSSQSVLLTIKSTNAGTSGYSEFHISNDANNKLIMGSIGSGYVGVDWANSAYIYDGSQSALRIKASNQLEFFSGGYTIASHRRMIIDSSGKVGIGITSGLPSTLAVKGAGGGGTIRVIPSSANGEASIGFYQDTTGTTSATRWVAGVGGWGNTGKFTIGYGAGGADVVVDTIGNLGIGVSDIKNKLSVNGSIQLGDWTTSGSRYIGFGRQDTGAFGTGGASGLEIESLVGSGLGTYDQNVHLWTHWYNNGSARVLTATWDRKIGVGNTSPAAPLHIGDGTNQQQWITNQSVAGWYSGIKLARGTGNWSTTGNNNFGFVVTDGGLEFAKFTTLNDSSRSVYGIISGSGNWGIGTTSPNADIHVRDSGQSGSITDAIPSWWSGIFERVYTTESWAANAIIGSSVATGGKGLLYLGNSDDVENTYLKGGANLLEMHGNELQFWGGAEQNWYTSGTFRMRLDSSGRLGVGSTVTSGARLHVAGEIFSDYRLRMNDGVGNLSIGHWDAANVRIEASGRPLLITSYTSNIKLGMNGSAMMTIDTTGVGINNTAPAHKLDIGGDIRLTDWTYFHDGTNYLNAWGNTASASYSGVGQAWALLSNYGGWHTQFIVDYDTGNVGIGTKAPVRRLDVDSGASSDIVRFGNVNGSMIFGQTASLTSLDLATSNAYRIRQGSSTPFYINTSGNIGVGTTNVTGKFTVDGDGFIIDLDYNANSAISISSTGTTGGYNAFTLGQANSTNNTGVMRFAYAGAGSTNNRIGWGFYANDDLLNLKANGTVGLGTTSPLSKFEVYEGETLFGTRTNSGDGSYFYDASTGAYYNKPRSIIGMNSSNTGGVEYGYPTLLLHNSHGGDGTWVKLAMGGREALSSGNTVSWAGIAAKKVSGVGGSWARGEFHIWVKDNATMIDAVKIEYDGTANFIGDIKAYSSSDENLKDNMKPIENALGKVMQVGGYMFDWNNKQRAYTGHDTGLSAQEFEKILPEVVTTRDNGFKAMKYEKTIPLLYQATKELKNEKDADIAKKDREIANLQEQLNELKELIKSRL